MDMLIRMRADGKICLEGDLWPGEAEEGNRFCIEADDLTIYADGGTKPLVKFSPSTLGNNVLCTRYVGTKAIPREFPIVWLQDGGVVEEQRAEDDVVDQPVAADPTAGVQAPLLAESETQVGKPATQGDVAVDPTTGAPTVAEPEPRATTPVEGPQVIEPAAVEEPGPASPPDSGVG